MVDVVAGAVVVAGAAGLEVCAALLVAALLVGAVVEALEPPPQADVSAPAASAVSARSLSDEVTVPESRAPIGPAACRFARPRNAAGRASWLARYRPVIDRLFTTTSQG